MGCLPSYREGVIVGGWVAVRVFAPQLPSERHLTRTGYSEKGPSRFCGVWSLEWAVWIHVRSSPLAA